MFARLLRRYIAHKPNKHSKCAGCSEVVLKQTRERGAVSALAFWWRRCRNRHSAMPWFRFATKFIAIVMSGVLIALVGTRKTSGCEPSYKHGADYKAGWVDPKLWGDVGTDAIGATGCVDSICGT